MPDSWICLYYWDRINGYLKRMNMTVLTKTIVLMCFTWPHTSSFKFSSVAPIFKYFIRNVVWSFGNCFVNLCAVTANGKKVMRLNIKKWIKSYKQTWVSFVKTLTHSISQHTTVIRGWGLGQEKVSVLNISLRAQCLAIYHKYCSTPIPIVYWQKFMNYDYRTHIHTHTHTCTHMHTHTHARTRTHTHTHTHTHRVTCTVTRTVTCMVTCSHTCIVIHTVTHAQS